MIGVRYNRRDWGTLGGSQMALKEGGGGREYKYNGNVEICVCTS